MKTAFVTGSTGLLGNNLVRALVARDCQVKALARNADKARQQFADLPQVEVVTGDMEDVPAFATKIAGCDVVFHVAAYFRDGYKGGRHWPELKRVNVDGTAALLRATYAAGVRRYVQTSSIAVLDGPPGTVVHESCDRDIANADDYYRSKILADREVFAFLDNHPDFHANFVLPGWMWGPADIGPTSAGQVALDVALGRLPGIVPGSFSLVDARDVAEAQIGAATSGRRGERYLAAGRHITMGELVPLIGRVAQVKTPTRKIPFPALYTIAAAQEVYARLTGKPILLSLANVRLMRREAGRSHFDHSKSKRELALQFRPMEETIRDTIAWYRRNGWLTPPNARTA